MNGVKKFKNYSIEMKDVLVEGIFRYEKSAQIEVKTIHNNQRNDSCVVSEEMNH